MPKTSKRAILIANEQNKASLLYMDIAHCSRLQAKRFFAAICYANHSISLFERQLVDLPETDWATVLLASIIIDNSGISSMKEDLISYVSSVVASEIGTKSHVPGEKSQHEALENEFWVKVPNQYILQNYTWLNPVIRACDPDKTTFTEDDYGTKLLDNLSEKLSVRLKSQNDKIYVEMRHSLEVIAMIIADPEITGATQTEVDGLMSSALTENVFHTIKKVSSLKRQRVRESFYEENEDVSKGLMLLVIMTLLFAATGLIFGFYCTNDEDRDAMRFVN